MREQLGPNWVNESIGVLDRDEPGWTRMEMVIYNRQGEAVRELVLFCKGGFEGERLPFDEGLEEFCGCG